jgi:O-antigen ligase
VGQLPWFTFALHAPLGAQLGGLSIIVLSAGTFLLVANQVQDLRWLSRMTWAFLAFGALYVLVRSVLPELGLWTRELFQPVGSVFSIWLTAMAFSQAAFNRDLHPAWRWALAGLVLVTLYILIFLKFADKSGWIPSLIGIAAVLAFRSWRAGLALLPLGALLAWYVGTGVIASDQYSVSTRYDAWLIMAQIIKINPIWGLGFANYYWYTPLFPIRGYAVSFNSHNNYVDILAQTGLVGLVCLLVFFWQAGRLGWRLRKQAPAGFARAYVYGALGGLVGTVVVAMFGDWVLPFFYNIGMDGFRSSMLAWLFLGGLVSLERMETAQSSSN